MGRLNVSPHLRSLWDYFDTIEQALQVVCTHNGFNRQDINVMPIREALAVEKLQSGFTIPKVVRLEGPELMKFLYAEALRQVALGG